MGRRLVAVTAFVAALLVACACAPRVGTAIPMGAYEGFDPTRMGRLEAWAKDSGIAEHHGRVPCERIAVECGALGAYDYIGRAVYVDPNEVAERQGYDGGSVDLWTYVRAHEWAHAVDGEIGFIFGVDPLALERSAQCGAELLLGLSWTPTGLANVYWDCPDSHLQVVLERWEAEGVL